MHGLKRLRYWSEGGFCPGGILSGLIFFLGGGFCPGGDYVRGDYVLDSWSVLSTVANIGRSIVQFQSREITLADVDTLLVPEHTDIHIDD